MEFKPNQRVRYVLRHGARTRKLPATILGPGKREGSWVIRLENHGLTLTVTEDELIPLSERDY